MLELCKKTRGGRTLLIIDNYDSFTYNIVQYVKMLEIEPIVIKNDELNLEDIKGLKFSRIILSPGWGNPDNSGITMGVINYYKDLKPILGVCLGMQCIAKYFGAKIVKAPTPFHGKNSKIFFDNDFELFKGFEQGFEATRYHSLMISEVKLPIKTTAQTNDNIPMAIKIEKFPIFGVQFHPEAILTQNGIKIFENFISIV